MSEEIEPRPAKRKWIISISQNPYVFLLSILLTVASILFAVYSHYTSRRLPELSYLIKPTRAVIVKTEQTSKLSVFYEGQEVMTDISAAQIHFWNNGDGIVRANSVIDPIVIETKGNVPILEASIRKVSRDPIKLRLDVSDARDGKINIGFDILERGDGGVIQVIYGGGPSVDLSVSGIVEDQKQLIQLGPSFTNKRVLIAMGVTGLIVLIASLTFIIVSKRDTAFRGEHYRYAFIRFKLFGQSIVIDNLGWLVLIADCNALIGFASLCYSSYALLNPIPFID